MSLTAAAAQRNALYDQIFDRLSGMCELLEASSASLEQERAKFEEVKERNGLVVEACQEVLASLDRLLPTNKKGSSDE